MTKLLETITSHAVAAELPRPRPLNIHGAVYFDLFIGFAGFERRSSLVPSKLSSSKLVQIAIAQIYRYEFENSDTLENLGRTRSSLAQMSSEVIESHPGVADSPLQIYGAVRTAVEGVGSAMARVAVDISGASSLAIISTIKGILESGCDVDLTIYYGEPGSYLPTESEYIRTPANLVSRACSYGDIKSTHEYGVGQIMPNELFPGFLDDSRSSFVVAVPSHRTAKIVRCIEEIDSSLLDYPFHNIQWILGTPPNIINSWRRDFQVEIVEHTMMRIDSERRDKGAVILSKSGPSVRNRSYKFASTYDYTEIFSLAVDIFDANIDKNISLLPMGGKLQALGLALALSARPEVCVKHAKPHAYNTHKYSVGIGECSSVHFRSVHQVRSRVAEIGLRAWVAMD